MHLLHLQQLLSWTWGRGKALIRQEEPELIHIYVNSPSREVLGNNLKLCKLQCRPTKAHLLVFIFFLICVFHLISFSFP